MWSPPRWNRKSWKPGFLTKCRTARRCPACTRRMPRTRRATKHTAPPRPRPRNKEIGAAMTMSSNDLTASSPPSAHAARFAYVGCFTTERRKARGKGIDIYAIDPVSGAWSPAGHVGDLVNPSFLVMDRARAVLYVVHGDADHVSAFA